MIGQISMLILVLVIIPFCVGLIPVNLIERQYRSMGVTYISGFIACLAVFQIITVPIVLWNDYGFRVVVPLFSILTVLMAGVGIFLTSRTAKKEEFTGEDEIVPFALIFQRKRLKPVERVKNKEKRERRDRRDNGSAKSAMKTIVLAVIILILAVVYKDRIFGYLEALLQSVIR